MCVISKACWLRIIKRNNFRNSFPAPPSPLRLRSLNQQHEIISVQIKIIKKRLFPFRREASLSKHCGFGFELAHSAGGGWLLVRRHMWAGFSHSPRSDLVIRFMKWKEIVHKFWELSRAPSMTGFVKNTLTRLWASNGWRLLCI